MHSALENGSRRLAVAAVAGTLALLALALPAAARADQLCYGSLKKNTAATASDDAAVQYEFTCREPTKAFNVTTSMALATFAVAADVFDPPSQGGAIRADDRFGECEGSIPGFGFNCSGFSYGLGRFTRATFSTMDDPCARDDKGRLALSARIVVEGTNNKLDGPFSLGKPSGCPAVRAAKKAKRKHHR